MRAAAWLVLIIVACLSAVREARADDLPALDEAIGQIVSIQAKDRYHRFVKLTGVTRAPKTGAVRSLAIERVTESSPLVARRSTKQPRQPVKQSIPWTSVEKLWRGDELIYVSDRLSAEADAEDRFAERAKAHGVHVWRSQSYDDYQQTLVEQRARLKKYGDEDVPGATLVENDEYLVLAQLPPADADAVARGLAAMHELLVKLFGYRPGTPIWQGKAMIVIFKTQADYQAFETKLYGDSPGFAEAVCTYVGPDDAEVLVLGCHNNKDQASFGHLFAHETSHGFVWRYRSAKHPPAWAKEGMAEVIGERASGSRDLSIRERAALEALRQTRTLDGLLDKRSIDFEQYAVASQLIKYMMAKDATAFVRFLDGIKEGLTWQQSLQQNWNCTPDDLVAAWGKSIGIPDLRP